MQSRPIIYLIDDDEVNCFLVRNILADTYSDCVVACFYSAPEALQALKEVKKEPVNFPSLILLDLHMPGKDGWDFLEEYASIQNNSFHTCDVVILTCSIYPQDIERAKKYPCVTDFIAKPFSEDAVTSRLDKIFYSKKCQ